MPVPSTSALVSLIPSALPGLCDLKFGTCLGITCRELKLFPRRLHRNEVAPCDVQPLDTSMRRGFSFRMGNTSVKNRRSPELYINCNLRFGELSHLFDFSFSVNLMCL